jgi:hypothetical protein
VEVGLLMVRAPAGGRRAARCASVPEGREESRCGLRVARVLGAELPTSGERVTVFLLRAALCDTDGVHDTSADAKQASVHMGPFPTRRMAFRVLWPTVDYWVRVSWWSRCWPPDLSWLLRWGYALAGYAGHPGGEVRPRGRDGGRGRVSWRGGATAAGGDLLWLYLANQGRNKKVC